VEIKPKRAAGSRRSLTTLCCECLSDHASTTSRALGIATVCIAYDLQDYGLQDISNGKFSGHPLVTFRSARANLRWSSFGVSSRCSICGQFYAATTPADLRTNLCLETLQYYLQRCSLLYRTSTLPVYNDENHGNASHTLPRSCLRVVSSQQRNHTACHIFLFAYHFSKYSICMCRALSSIRCFLLTEIIPSVATT
jgi:hypothetical protein